MSDGGAKIIQAAIDMWKSMSKAERRKAMQEAIAKTTETQRASKEQCATHNHPPRYDDVFVGAVSAMWQGPLGDSDESEEMSDELERLYFDLQAAAWDVVLELSDARREMGLDFPDELAVTYEHCGKLEDALLALKGRSK